MSDSVPNLSSRPQHNLGVITLEVDHVGVPDSSDHPENPPSNRGQLLFNATMQTLRSRWDIHRMPSAMSPDPDKGIQSMPVIPGMYIELDTRTKKGRTYDPLSLPENKELLRKIATVYKHVFFVEGQPDKETPFENLTDDNVATWLYWMMRAVNDGDARVVSGRVPDLEEIKRAYPRARVQKEVYDTIGVRPGIPAVELVS